MGVLFSVSYITLWVLVIALSLLVVGVLQQIGLLQRKLRSSGIQEESDAIPELPPLENDGPAIGEQLLDLTLETVNNTDSVTLVSSSNEPGTLLFFLSPTCEACQHLVASINAVIESGVYSGRAIAILRADEYSVQGYLNLFPLHIPVVCDSSRTLTKKFGVHRAPFALLYNSQGLLIRKGIIQKKAEILALLGESSALFTDQSNLFPSVMASSLVE